MKLPISDIKIGAGRREARSEEVRKLADSIAEVGLLNPVTVDQSHTLIAGRHRLEAVRLLGWTEIECTVCGLEGIAAEIAEIDENFVRTNASAIEIGEMLKRRKQLYETLHPETKAGVGQQRGLHRAVHVKVVCRGYSRQVGRPPQHRIAAPSDCGGADDGGEGYPVQHETASPPNGAAAVERARAGGSGGGSHAARVR